MPPSWYGVLGLLMREVSTNKSDDSIGLLPGQFRSAGWYLPVQEFHIREQLDLKGVRGTTDSSLADVPGDQLIPCMGGIRKSLSESPRASLVTLTRTQYLSWARIPSGVVGIDRAEADWCPLVGALGLLSQLEASPSTNVASKESWSLETPASSVSFSVNSFLVAISAIWHLFQ